MKKIIKIIECGQPQNPVSKVSLSGLIDNNKQNKRATDRAIRMKNEDTTTQEKERFNYDNAEIYATDIAWGAIKKAAMQDNYESQPWYVSF